MFYPLPTDFVDGGAVVLNRWEYFEDMVSFLCQMFQWTSPKNKNILSHQHRTVIKIRKLTLLQYNYLKTWFRSHQLSQSWPLCQENLYSLHSVVLSLKSPLIWDSSSVILCLLWRWWFRRAHISYSVDCPSIKYYFDLIHSLWFVPWIFYEHFLYPYSSFIFQYHFLLKCMIT